VLLSYRGIIPTIAPSAFVAEGAAVIGDVQVGAHSSIWFNCTVRGDVHHIRIGEHTNIQDNSCIHVTRITHPTIIGSGVTIGHSVTLHGCTLMDDCFIGMGATLLDGVVVESGGMVAAGALVPPNKRVKAGELWAGTPAKFFRALSTEENAFIPISAENYVRLKAEYLV
jgi:gamma-carbonic anhydrase